MNWNYQYFMNWMDHDCDKEEALKVEKLYLDDNDLTTLPVEIGNLQNLQGLYLSCNYLTTIPDEIGNLRNLKELYLNNNILKTLPEEIGNIQNLQVLNLSSNKLTSIPKEIGNLQNLQVFDLSDNYLTTLPKEIGKLQKLQYLQIMDNKLRTIPTEIGNLQNLIHIYLQINKLRTLPAEIGNLQNLQRLYFNNNPFEYIPPNVNRFLHNLKQEQNIYNDRQSIHNHNIQETFRQTVFSLLNDTQNKTYKKEQVFQEIMNDTILTERTKEQLIEYSNETTPHSVLNITFGELLLIVWNRIQTHKDKDEIKKILNQEMSDALCMCFTGRLTRLVNSLNGFYEDIKIQISSNEQIGNILVRIKETLEEKNEYTREKHIEEVKKELEERKYDNDVIEEWISYI